MGASKHGKSTKTDRNRKSGGNLRYINEQKHDKSHVRRLNRHLARFIGDKMAETKLAFYKARLGVRGR
jgi:hypothetical protein